MSMSQVIVEKQTCEAISEVYERFLKLQQALMSHYSHHTMPQAVGHAFNALDDALLCFMEQNPSLEFENWDLEAEEDVECEV